MTSYYEFQYNFRAYLRDSFFGGHTAKNALNELISHI